MPNFISLLQDELNNTTHWVFAQEASTRDDLENNNSFGGISKIRKTTETYKKSSNASVRTIQGVVTGSIKVLTFQLVKVAAIASPGGRPFALTATKKKSPLKSNKKAAKKKVAKKAAKKTPKKK